MAKYIELMLDPILVVCPRCNAAVEVESATVAITADGIDLCIDEKLSRNTVECESCRHAFAVYLHCHAHVEDDGAKALCESLGRNCVIKEDLQKAMDATPRADRKAG